MLFQIASVVVSKALYVHQSHRARIDLSEAYISKANAPMKTVVRKAAFFRKMALFGLVTVGTVGKRARIT